MSEEQIFALAFSGLFLILFPVLSVIGARKTWGMVGVDGEMREELRTKTLREGVVSNFVILVLVVMIGIPVGPSFSIRPIGRSDFFGVILPQLFRIPDIISEAIGASLLALIFCLLLLPVSKWIRTDEENRKAFIHQLIPRTIVQWIYLLVSLPPGIAAIEIAYRGLGPILLRNVTGAVYLPMLLCCMASSLLYASQGWKSVLILFVQALVFQALFVVTESLIPVIIVNFVYCLLVFILMGVVHARHRRQSDLAANLESTLVES